jgi:hypothetical protein
MRRMGQSTRSCDFGQFAERYGNTACGIERLTTRDLGALTPLIWDHVNPYDPYGRFDLDMETRLPSTDQFGGW